MMPCAPASDAPVPGGERKRRTTPRAADGTGWVDRDEEFESAVHAAVDSAYDNPQMQALIAAMSAGIEPHGWVNSLSQKVIQLTMPGVPDVYQGSELWETSLVDPDNRRPVDFDERRLYLAAIDAGAHPPIDESGAAKLLVTSRALRLRRDRPEFFTRYVAIEAYGSAAKHVVAFDRGEALTVATRLPIGLVRGDGWGDTSVIVAGRPMTDVFTGQHFDGGTLRLSELLERYPVALLVPSE